VYQYDALGFLASDVTDVRYGQKLEFDTLPSGLTAELREQRKERLASEVFTTSYQYDKQGNRIVSKDPLAGIELNPTDANPSAVTQAATVTRQYDAQGLLLVTSTDRNGVSEQKWYNAVGQLHRERNAAGLEKIYTYNLAGNVISIEQPAIGDLPYRMTSFEYDILGRLRATTEHGVTDLHRYFDYFKPTDTAEGFDEAVTEPSGAVTATVKDSLGQPVFVKMRQVVVDGVGTATPVKLFSYAYSSQTGVQTVYSTTSLLSGTDAADLAYAGRQTTRSYFDNAGNLLQTAAELRGGTTTFVDTVEYGYDANGRMKSRSATGRTTSYVFDDDIAGSGGVRLEVVSDGNSSKDTYYDLDSSGNVLRKSDKNDSQAKTRSTGDMTPWGATSSAIAELIIFRRLIQATPW
jgi:YD repeat-containing protein